MSEKIFVTGATGFIGSNLVKRLVGEGKDVFILVNQSKNHPLLKGLGLERISGNIIDSGLVKNINFDFDYIFHTAAYISFNRKDFSRLYAVNVEGTKNVINLALKSKIKRLIFTSACAVFGTSDNNNILLNENSTASDGLKGNLYALTKKIAEEEVLQACRNKNLDAVIVTPSTVYGQGDMRLNSGYLVKKIFQNQIRFAPPGGTSCVSVDDVVEGHLLAMKNGRAGERYILNSLNISYFDLFNLMAETLGKLRIKFILPRYLYIPTIFSAKVINFFTQNWLITPQIIKEAFRFKYFSSQKAQKELNWQPNISLSAAIKNAFDFYKKYNLFNG